MTTRVAAVRLVAVVATLLVAGGVAAADDGFSLGVAAGDVRFDSAILWTRADSAGDIRYELALDEHFADVARVGVVTAESQDDLTVAVSLADLAPETEYFFRFSRDAEPAVVSRIGRFVTAPSPDLPADLRFVFSGDTNIAFAPFALVDELADENADFFLWFGDTIYGDDPARPGGVATTLEDYRNKYREIRRDPHMQNALAVLPIWTGWDDHEVENDYAGADPNIPPQQLLAAYRAFFEYMPIERQSEIDEPFKTYRGFQWGAATEFFLVDVRQYRDVSAEAECGGALDPLGAVLGLLSADASCAAALSAPRTMLGREQLDWLKQGLLNSTATVKFVVNGVPLSYLGVLPFDRWDGYDAERRELLEFIDSHEIGGVVFLTTDFHSNWYNPDVGRYFRSRRPNYDLANGVQVIEAVVGPLGIETMRETLLETGATYLGLRDNPLGRAALSVLERLVMRRLTRTGGFAMSETNRKSYAVITVSADGDLEVAYRGAPPEQASVPGVTAETFYSSEDDTGFASPCFIPVLSAGLMVWPALVAFRARAKSARR